MSVDLWTLPELAERVAEALRGSDAEQASARVRAVPDARTIRWYQTTGLVDRPAALRGRTTLYGRLHLLQLVAIKKLQAQGRSLADIQADLAGMSTAALERLADVPPTSGQESEPARPVRSRFWTESAAELTDPTVPGEAVPLAAAAAPAGAAQTAAPASRPVHGVRLHDQVLVVLDGATTPLDPTDLDDVHEAAAPLLDALRRKGLIR